MKKKERTNISVLVVMLVLIAAVGVVSAAPSGVNPTSSKADRYIPTTTTTDSARGGNITNVNFTDIYAQTSKWQAYYGNITGTVTLSDHANGNSQGNYLKEWSWSNTTSNSVGYVIATTNTTVPFWWALVAITDPKAKIDTQWSFPATDVDSATNTFNSNKITSSLTIAGKDITPTEANVALTRNANASADKWETVPLAFMAEPTVQADHVFVGVTNQTAAATAFNNVASDFQMIVPVNHSTGTTGVQPYYFYVELQ